MTKSWTILTGDNRHTLRTIADNTIDAIVTDPPYGIDFLGKAWDANTGALETYQECLRVLKPGGHILAFSAARTYHHLAVTLEQAGFEIRDQIMWIYSSGFPKSQDVGRSIQRSLGVKEKRPYDWNAPVKGGRGSDGDLGAGDFGSSGPGGQIVPTDPEAQQWSGWGTALKPAHEPICLARKPMKLSIAKNCQTHGVGALNIDACRIPTDQPPNAQMGPVFGAAIGGADPFNIRDDLQHYEPHDGGRFPSNVIGDIPLYQKYFYCPKVSRAERHVGFDDSMSEKKMLEIMGGHYTDPSEGGKSIWLPGKGVIYAHGLKHEYSKWCKNNNIGPGNIGNNHPTVKPVELMKYLIQLITPAGGTVLDPFAGSGSTGMAAVALGHTFVGCELDAAYVAIANRRIQAWLDLQRDPNFDRLFEIAE